jgi:hypothetical protein
MKLAQFVARSVHPPFPRKRESSPAKFSITRRVPNFDQDWFVASPSRNEHWCSPAQSANTAISSRDV